MEEIYLRVWYRCEQHLSHRSSCFTYTAWLDRRPGLNRLFLCSHLHVIWKPLRAWRLLIHPQTEETNTCTSGSVSVFLLGVRWTSCRSFLSLVLLELIFINKDGSEPSVQWVVVFIMCVTVFGHFKRCWVLVELVERFPSVFLCSLCCMCPRLVNAHVKPTIGRLWADSALTPDLWGGSVPWRWILWVLASWECRGQVDADWGAWLVQNKV